jgi:hypothetical protein
MKRTTLTEDMDPVLRVRIVRDEMSREFPTVKKLMDHIYKSGPKKKVEPRPGKGDIQSSPWETMFDGEEAAVKPRKAMASASTLRVLRKSKSTSSNGQKDKGSNKSSSKH